MFTQIRGPDQHFSAFYKDDSILIQFIVEEFIKSHQLTLKINTLIQQRLDTNLTLESLCCALKQILSQLVGCLSQQEGSSFSRWSKGSLTKFKEYCEQFSCNSMRRNKQHTSLHMAAHQAWLTAIHNLEILNSLYSSSYISNAEVVLFLVPFRRTFRDLQMRIDQISRYIPRVMRAFWNNENVILCLLRKKALLTEIYGANFLHNRFKWPMKTSELIELLVQRYQARGFEALLPTIQHLHELEDSCL